MKKLVIFTMILCLILGCCGCSDSGSGGNQKETKSQTTNTQGNETTAQVGDVLDAPEKLVSLSDMASFTLEIKSTTNVSDGDRADDGYFDVLYSFNTNSSEVEYYSKAVGMNVIWGEGTEPYNEEFYCLVKDGVEYAYISYNDSDNEADMYTESVKGETLQYISDFAESNEQVMKENFAYYGLDYKYVYDSDIQFKKCEDQTVNGFDCFVYKIISDDESIEYETLHVDKKTGIWVRDEYVMNEDGYTIKEIFEIISINDDAEIPKYDISDFE